MEDTISMLREMKIDRGVMHSPGDLPYGEICRSSGSLHFSSHGVILASLMNLQALYIHREDGQLDMDLM